MTGFEDLIVERERLLTQQTGIRNAVELAMVGTDLGDAGRALVRDALGDGLIDAFFPLLDPLDREIEDRRRAEAIAAVLADLSALRRRQL